MNNTKWLRYLFGSDDSEPEYDPSLSLIDENIFNSLDMTYLTESEIALLMEGRKENVLKKYGNIVDDHALEILMNFDEQYRYKHLAWMARELASVRDREEYKYVEKEERDWEWYRRVNNAQEELATAMIAGIEDFIDNQQLMKIKDINQYPNFKSLLDALQTDVIDRRIKKSRKEREKNLATKGFISSGQGSVVYEDDRYFVVRPESPQASCHFGAKTRWCIAQAGNTYFSQYTEGSGRIFYFIKDDSKKNEAYNYKMAVEMSNEGGGYPYVENIWDRYDESYVVEDAQSEDSFAFSLVQDFEMPEDRAEQIAAAIFRHAENNPPHSPLAQLEDRINNDEFDGGFVTLRASSDYDYESQLSIIADVIIKHKILDADLVRMLNEDEIDIHEADEAIKEALEEDGVLYKLLDDNVDIGASKYWWPSAENIEVTTFEEGEGENLSWFILIELSNFEDPDYSGMYTSDISEEAERFCELMQEEWGERNEAEIEEVLDRHLYRLIPEYAKKHADKFLKLKEMFSSGKHQMDNIYFTVDDEDEEMSDLNLFMDFTFPLNPEYVKLLFSAKEEELETAAGPMKNIVIGLSQRGNKLRAHVADLFRSDIGANNVSQRGHSSGMDANLHRAVFNVYSKARDAAMQQLSFDFGDQYDTSNDIAFPTIPKDIMIKAGLDYDGGAIGQNLVPTDVKAVITVQIYIPFNHDAATLEAIMYFFKFIDKNYTQISAYMHRYTNEYARIGVARKVNRILAENLFYSIIDSKTFLEELTEQLKLHEKSSKSAKRKRRAKVKKKKAKKAKKDACYHKVRARYDVWPSAYASGALVKCRKVGADNWGNSTKEGIEKDLELDMEFIREVEDLLSEKKKKRKLTSKPGSETNLRDWFKRKGAKGSKGGWVDCNAPDGKGGYKSCGRGDGEKRKRYPACRPTASACKKMKGSKGKSWGKKDAKRRGKKK